MSIGYNIVEVDLAVVASAVIVEGKLEMLNVVAVVVGDDYRYPHVVGANCLTLIELVPVDPAII